MWKLAERFEQYKKDNKDFSGHVSKVYGLTNHEDVVVEIGCQFGIGSSTAFAMARPAHLICIDKLKQDRFEGFLTACEYEDINVEYIITDSLEITIPPCDILFIDSWHTYDQLKQELALHGNKAKKYLIFHDTAAYCCGNTGQDTKSPGLLAAINEFKAANTQWQEIYNTEECNGLIILLNNNSVVCF